MHELSVSRALVCEMQTWNPLRLLWLSKGAEQATHFRARLTLRSELLLRVEVLGLVGLRLGLLAVACGLPLFLFFHYDTFRKAFGSISCRFQGDIDTIKPMLARVFLLESCQLELLSELLIPSGVFSFFFIVFE